MMREATSSTTLFAADVGLGVATSVAMWALGIARRCGDFHCRRGTWHYCGRVGPNAREQGSSHSIGL